MLRKYFMVMNTEKKASNICIYIIQISFCLLFNIASAQTDTSTNVIDEYSFIVAGHAYGAHTGENLGLYPKFKKKLTQIKEKYDFIVFTGDVIRGSNGKWQVLQEELSELNIENYLVMGNNEYSSKAKKIFNERFGKTFYTFKKGKELFIILDTQQDSRRISKEQLMFVKEVLNKNKRIENVFVFIHELLWNQHQKFKNINSNKRSRHENIQTSNFWTEFTPLIRQLKETEFYIIAGDVAGNIEAIPAFYYNEANITLLASGMGEVEEENYLSIKVKNSKVSLKLISLDSNKKLKEVEFYNIKNMSSYFNPRFEVLYDKIFKNITHIQFIRGVTSSTAFYILITIFFFIRKKRRNNKK